MAERDPAEVVEAIEHVESVLGAIETQLVRVVELLEQIARNTKR